MMIPPSIKKFGIIFLGFFIFSVYFWNRFLRYRIPRELPLSLSPLGFFCIFYICCIFLYIVLALTFSRSSNSNIEKFIDWLFIPIKEFDKFLKSFSVLKSIYDKLLFLSLPNLNFLIIHTYLFYVIFWVFPRILLLLVLGIDTFILHKFEYRYQFVSFGILIFFQRYFRYSLKETKKELITFYSPLIRDVQVDYYPGIHPVELEEDYDPENEEDADDAFLFGVMYIPLDIFIEFQTKSIVHENITRKVHMYYTSYKLQKELWEKYLGEPMPDSRNLPKDYTSIFGGKNATVNYNRARSFIFKKQEEFTKAAVEEIMQISLLVEYYNVATNEDKKMKNMKILIYLNYFICWLYVLIISLPKVDVYNIIIMINETWIKIPNLFLS